MKYFDWDDAKNKKLKKFRNISFEEALFSISSDKLLDIIIQPNQTKYPNQKVFVVEISNYAYFVPFIEDEEKYFLKTIYPSRAATKHYLSERK